MTQAAYEKHFGPLKKEQKGKHETERDKCNHQDSYGKSNKRPNNPGETSKKGGEHTRKCKSQNALKSAMRVMNELRKDTVLRGKQPRR